MLVDDAPHSRFAEKYEKNKETLRLLKTSKVKFSQPRVSVVWSEFLLLIFCFQLRENETTSADQVRPMTRKSSKTMPNICLVFFLALFSPEEDQMPNKRE